MPDAAPKDSRDLEDSLDIFHTFREGGLPCGQPGGGQPAPWSEPKRPRRSWTGWAVRENRGRATPHETSRLWRQAEGLWDQAMAAERAWKLTRSAFEFFTPEGRCNDRQQAQAVVAAAPPHLSGPAWAKTRRLLRRRESFTFLDQVQRRLTELGLDPDVLSALLDLEGLRAKPGDCRSQRPGQPRHGLGRWPARSNWRRQNPTGRN